MEENKIRTTVDDLIAQAEDQYAKFIKSGKYKDLLLSMSNLNCYSLTNHLLILSQMPTATCVNGMKTWNFNHRNIIKGEKAIKIIAPLREVRKEDVLDEDGNVVETKEITINGFKVAYVFDISQTEGRELYEFKCDENVAVDSFDAIKDAIEKIPRGYSVRYSELDDGVDGYCDFKNKEIVIRSGMIPTRTLTTLIHEVGHALAEERVRVGFKGLTPKEQTKIREIEAESIALVVSNRLGLQTTDFNLGYIAKFSDGDLDKFKANLDVVRSVSYQILSCVEPAIQTHLKEKEAVKQEESQPQESPEISPVSPENEASEQTIDTPEEKPKTRKRATKSKASTSEVEQC